jgi:hypothetical protein
LLLLDLLIMCGVLIVGVMDQMLGVGVLFFIRSMCRGIFHLNRLRQVSILLQRCGVIWMKVAHVV